MDEGWPIHSSVTRDNLHVGEYVLEQDQPSHELARSWSLAQKPRGLRTAGGVVPPKHGLLEYMKALHPNAADKEQLAFVTGSSHESDRCLRELIAEGWPILSTLDDASPVAWRVSALVR